MNKKLDKIIEKIERDFRKYILKKEYFRGDYTFEVKPEGLREFMTFLKNDDDAKFNLLSSITGIDYSKLDDDKRRFGVAYTLRSIPHRIMINIRVRVPEENARVDSMVSLWKTANWQEREVYDLYGIYFDKHPDMRRILLDPKDFGKVHPLRKDYPLKGQGERHSPLKNYGDNL
jgi:NADH-quinone oxidoreductase subunit C